MQSYLAQWWNTGSIVGEFSINVLMLFTIPALSVFAFTKFKKHEKLLFPLFLVISFMSSIRAGMGIANFIEPGSGLGLAIPMFDIFVSITSQSYHLLPSLIISQVLGDAMGFLLFIAYLKMIKQDIPVVKPKKELVPHTIQSIVFQIIFIVGIVAIDGSFSVTSGNADVLAYINFFIIGFWILVLMYISAPLGSFVFNPFADIVVTAISCVKTKQWKVLIENTIDIFITTTVVIAISFGVYGLSLLHG